MSDSSFKKILVYVTTRNDQHSALRRATSLARHCGASLTLLSVAEELSLLLQRSVSGHADLVASLKAETKEHLLAVAKPFVDEGLPVSTVVRYGKPHLEVIRDVLRSKYDLVLKTAEADALTPIFGSTAMKLLRLCPVPVWIEKPVRRRALRNIVAAVDPFAEDEAGRQLNRKIIEIAATVAAGRRRGTDWSARLARLWREHPSGPRRPFRSASFPATEAPRARRLVRSSTNF